ncbi:MAG: putative metal-dependent hydrolase [Acidobacteria bacterium]|nr:putative metal-dependent hydrolase [Acidobacteriota bacterium]
MSLDPRYPIGKPNRQETLTPQERAAAIEKLEAAPRALREAVEGLNDDQLNTPYREGGWTVRQVIHHLADSHINAYMRFKFAVAEDNPTLKGYDENVWAAHEDGATMPVSTSLQLIDALHGRLCTFIRSLEDAEFQRTWIHTESGPHTVDWLLGIYAWHGEHHAAHITELRKARSW